MYNLKIRTCFNLILSISIFAIVFAYFAEYILGYQPCNLCLIERIPYALSIFLIVINYLIKIEKKFILILLILIFLFSFSISFYHLGIEQGFFEESAVCGLKNTIETLSKEEIIKQLNEKQISCKDVTFRVFGLSLTSINMIVSLALVLILIKAHIKYEKNK